MRTFVSFQYYDQKGRRLTICGDVVDSNLQITVITCSKNDQFVRRTGKELFAQIKAGSIQSKVGQTFNIPLEKDDVPGKLFNQFCHESFFKKVEESVRITRTYLKKGLKLVPVKNGLKINHKISKN